MKIATIIGARPQFIKSGPVSKSLRFKNINEVLIHTGQHYDDNMSDVFFNELDLKRPNFQLNVGSASHANQTADMLKGIEQILKSEKPDMVLVYGDTNSTLAGALAAVKIHIPVAHVEAGLRSFNRKMPEEINRILTDHASSLLFAPTDTAVSNLKKEGFSETKVHLVGDVMYDATIMYGNLLVSETERLSALGVRSDRYILVTIHRAENTDSAERIKRLTRVLSDLSAKFQVVCPLHPRTSEQLRRLGLLDEWSSRLTLLPPVGYLDMLALERHADRIVTDSGGVQKEAFFQRVPCVTVRDETEWTELVDLGWNRLVPPDRLDVAAILESFSPERDLPIGLYGGGQAAHRITDHILKYNGGA